MLKLLDLLQCLQYNRGVVTIDGLQAYQIDSIDITSKGVVKIANGVLKGHILNLDKREFIILGDISQDKDSYLSDLTPQRQYHLVNGLLHLKELGLTKIDWVTLTKLISSK